MARYGASPVAQAQRVTADILLYLRTVIPTLLSKQDQFLITHTLRIRNGVAEVLTRHTRDYFREPIHHVNLDECDVQLKRIEATLLRELPNHLGSKDNHGSVSVTVTVKDKTVAFAFEAERQTRYTWREDGTSAT